METICAFDIGIKNLSFCILNKSDKKNEIIRWELIDLRTKQHTCIGRLLNGGNCGKPAKYEHKSNSDIFYCDKHVTQYNPIISNAVTTDTQHQCEYSGCDKKCTHILDNVHYCPKHLKKIQTQQISNNKLRKIKLGGCMKEPLYDLGRRMYDTLNNIPEILITDRIVIENQPSLTNPTMKSISILLFGYFIVMKHPCVEFISPSKKLKVNEQLTKSILSECTTKPLKYSTTKELGVKYSEELLKSFIDNTKWFELLHASKKKDDLCDAFLHAYVSIYGHSELLSTEKFMNETKKYFAERKAKKEITKKSENKIVLNI